jgi:tRNA-dihydrouridine synthase 2
MTTTTFDLEEENARNRLTSQQITGMYRETKILAPMVRIGQLPFRCLVANEYGADVVYSEELIDKKLLRTKRTLNHVLQCVEYIDTNDMERINKIQSKLLEKEMNQYMAKVGNEKKDFKPSNKLSNHLKGAKPVFQTSPLHEPKPLVLQIGTSNADLALETAKHMYRDYDVIDINCGCPKHFSISGGMGAALLKDRAKLCSILKNLVNNIDKPVTCKIRLLDRMENTIDLVKSIEQAGVMALAVHARYIEQRSRVPAHLHMIEQIKSAISIPLIANGDCFKYEDFASIRETYRCDAVMTARGALWNPSIFQPEPIPKTECALKLISYIEKFHGHDINTKYILSKMFEHPASNNSVFKKVSQSRTHEEMKKILETCSDPNSSINENVKRNMFEVATFEPNGKKQKVG